MKQQDFDALLADRTKQISGPITWEGDEDHSLTVEFRMNVISEAKYPLFVKGSYNETAQTLTYALIHQKFGRIYALDLGKDHHNPSCSNVGRKHKHRWSETYFDKDAYIPDDITALVTDPVGVWKQFCSEALLTHDGEMRLSPLLQLDLELF